MHDSKPAESSAATRKRHPHVGDTWRSADPRDKDRRTVEVVAVDGHPTGYVYYESSAGRRHKVRLRNWNRLYTFKDGPYA